MQRYLFIANGIGITPFRSILRDLQSHPKEAEITLIYAVDSPTRLIFKDFFDELAEQSWFNVEYISEVSWSKRLAAIKQEVSAYTPDQSLYYLSGSPRAITDIQSMLSDQGISHERIKTDSFAGL